MDTFSPTRSADSLLAFRPAALAFGLACAAPLAAQSLVLDASDLTVPWSDVVTVTKQNYLVLRTTCPLDGAGQWILPAVFAYQTYPQTQYPLQQTAVASVLAPMLGVAQGDIVTDTDFIDGNAATLTALFEDALHATGTSTLSGVAVHNHCDPIYVDPTPGPNGEQICQQFFGMNPGGHWQRHPALDVIINSDSMLQAAVWDRVAPTTELDRTEFFTVTNGGYAEMLQQGISLAITMVGIRGPNGPSLAPPGTSIPNVPGLNGFPVDGIPPLKVSNVSRIHFGGNNSTWEWVLRFGPQTQHWVGNLGSHNLIAMGTPGGRFVAAASGYAPGMQVQLFQNGAPGVVYTLDVTWVDDGVIGFEIPAQCATANHSVRKCRHYMGEVGGQPVYGPWLTIPQGQRALITVQ